MLVKACSLARLQREKRFVLCHQGQEVVIFALGEKLFALNNSCPHQGMPLEDGILDPERETLTCIYHDWRFQLSSGQALHCQARIQRFELELKDGDVWVELDDHVKMF